jgi:prophage regulatory protein
MKEEMQEDIEKLKLLTWKEVTAVTGLSRMTITREIQKGNFPKPVNISERKVRFKFEEIEKWRNSLN